ncbi:hypothetical protein D9M71_350810 [compost metagenome]
MRIRHWLIACCVTAAFPAHAESRPPIELTDAQLDQLRGRFVMPGRVVSFGVVMSSSWQAANGQVLGGQVSMQMQRGMPAPVFNVTLFDNGRRGALPAGSGQVLGGAGLGQVQGISQSTRSAGDFNTSHNGMNIAVSQGSLPAGVPRGSPVLEATRHDSSLGQVSVAQASGGLRMSIQATGQGSSMQQLGGGSLIQRTDIIGSRNAVENLTQLNVVLGNGPSANDLNAAMAQLTRPGGF